MKPRMEIGGRYNWRSQSERLVYLGKNWSGTDAQAWFDANCADALRKQHEKQGEAA